MPSLVLGFGPGRDCRLHDACVIRSSLEKVLVRRFDLGPCRLAGGNSRLGDRLVGGRRIRPGGLDAGLEVISCGAEPGDGLISVRARVVLQGPDRTLECHKRGLDCYELLLRPFEVVVPKARLRHWCVPFF